MHNRSHDFVNSVLFFLSEAKHIESSLLKQTIYKGKEILQQILGRHIFIREEVEVKKSLKFQKNEDKTKNNR